MNRKVIERMEEAREKIRLAIAEIAEQSEVPLLDLALTHKSYANEAGGEHNQRLEFLGDAVLGLITSESLVHEQPDADEGRLSRQRSAIVSADALALWARKVDLGAGIALGRGAHAAREHEQTNVLSDTVEAIVAAVYLAGGLEPARRLVHDIMETVRAEKALDAEDAKSALQRRVQANGHAAPVYDLVASEGPANAQVFEVAVSVDGNEVGRGRGPSKRNAERAAAEAALESLDRSRD